jgi:DNA-binding NtrC family response regulator
MEPDTPELRILERVSSSIASTLDLHDLYRICLEMLDELFGFRHTLLLLLDETGDALTVVAARGYEDPVLGASVPVGTGVHGVVARKRRILHLTNLGRQRAYASAQRRRLVEAGRSDEIGPVIPVPGLPDVESQIAVPLSVKDTLVGVFSVESPRPQEFGERDEELLSIVANQMAAAIQNARLHRELLLANERLELRVAERTAEIEHELRVARELVRDARRRVEGALLGDSAAVRELRERIEAFGRSDEPVLVAGPPGSGREAVARAIHAASARASGTFLHVACPLLETDDREGLFGTTVGLRGDGPADAKFALAAGGTIYLDSVNELPERLQADLAAVLDRQKAARERGERPNPDVRVLLGVVAEAGAEPSAARLARVLLRVPSLESRREDIPKIAEAFAREHARHLGKDVQGFTPASVERLKAYRWPGNVRELRHVVERAVILARGPVLEIAEEELGEAIPLGSYRLVQLLGSGGMGEVWLARHALLARPAAVKLIRDRDPAATRGSEMRSRFLREAEVTASLRSPHTVQLYDFGVSDTGTFYYVMEYLEGLDLAQMVKRFGPLPPERAVALLAQICVSLGEAHRLGLVHRDIKPANLFVTAFGPEVDFVKVLDFGVVKRPHDEDTADLTGPGQVHGTPAFMAPEFALSETVDARADIYSLGCVAYWMLTGQLVFDAPNPARMILHHVQTPPTAPSEIAEEAIPPALDRLVLRCLGKDPATRPESADRLREELDELRLEPPWTAQRARSWWRTHAPQALAGPPST